MKLQINNTGVHLVDEDGRIGTVRRPNTCQSCYGSIFDEVTDGRTLDGRTTIQPVYNYDRDQSWTLHHKVCPTRTVKR